MDDRLRGDFAIEALTAEVERRRKQPEKYGFRYSYGKLVADTTEEERVRIVDCYREGKQRSQAARARYREPNDEEDLKKATEAMGV